MLASHAWYAGFSKAAAKGLMSHGSSAIEKLQREYFSHYVSVLDLVHALSYALAAARASTTNDDDAWICYVQWAERIWQGQVSQVIRDLKSLHQQMGSAPDDAVTDDPREIVRRALAYCINHQSRMKYPEYRRQGFPITSDHGWRFSRLLNHLDFRPIKRL